jgi:hypothetical protein
LIIAKEEAVLADAAIIRPSADKAVFRTDLTFPGVVVRTGPSWAGRVAEVVSPEEI